MPYHEVAACVDGPVEDALALVDQFFDAEAILQRPLGLAGIEDYYRQSDRGYRLFHSREGALHIALGCDGHNDTSGYSRQAEVFAEHLDATKARHAVELGCGMGYNVRWLAKQRPGVTFLGIDLTEDHIRHAKKQAAGLANAQFVAGNYESMTYSENAFDAALAVETLCQTPHLDTALAEAARVLRPGARLVVIDCFRAAPLETLDAPLQRAARLVERTTAVEGFRCVGDWIETAGRAGLQLVETRDLSAETSDNLARLHRLAKRYFKMPAAFRALTKAFPKRMMENGICGLLMPYTVGFGAHTYQAIVVEA
ncbi:MAG: methyltransferase domain-containing protein [Planctomycetota bacterium]